VDKLGPERLKLFALFAELSDAQLTKITHCIKQKRIPEGDDIVREGETGEELFLLLEGEIEISKRLTLFTGQEVDQKEKGLIRLKDENNVFFGEMALFGVPERSATVTALTGVTVGFLTKEQIHTLSESDPHIGYHLFFNIGRTLSSNLRRANRDILKLTTAFCLALERS